MLASVSSSWDFILKAILERLVDGMCLYSGVHRFEQLALNGVSLRVARTLAGVIIDGFQGVWRQIHYPRVLWCSH